MIRHTVLFKLKPNVTPQVIEQIYADIIKSIDNAQGIAGMTGGSCHFTSTNDSIFSHGISIDFEDRPARDTFILNSERWASVLKKIADITQNGEAGLFVFDFR